MTHWLSPIIDILRADTGDLRLLAKIAGSDPRTFYSGVNLSKADLRGQNLTGMGLTNEQLAGAIIDDDTIIDYKYRELTDKRIASLHVIIPTKLMELVNIYSESHEFTSESSALDSIISLARESPRRHNKILWHKIVSNKDALQYLNHPSKIDKNLIFLQTSRRNIFYIKYLWENLGDFEKSYRAAVLIGILNDYIRKASSYYDKNIINKIINIKIP